MPSPGFRYRLPRYLAFAAVLAASGSLFSIRAASITNTNAGVVWTTNTNGWAVTGSNPWSSLNGVTNTAVFTNASATVTATNTGVWLGGITFTNSAAATLTLGGGTLNFSGTSASISLLSSNSLLSITAPVLASNASGNTMTVSGAGTVSFSGTNRFQTVSVNTGTFQIAAGNTTFLNEGTFYGNPAGLIRLAGGTLTCSAGASQRNNWMITGGVLASSNRFSVSAASGQWLLMTGGTLQANGTLGLRVASDGGYGSSGGSAASLTNAGGMIRASSMTLGGFTTAGAGGTVTLSSGTITFSGDVGLQSAANRGSTNLLILSGGRFSCSGTLQGQTNAGALQAILWNGGAMAPSVVNMTNLSSSTNPYTNGTLSNGGGTFAPGDAAFAGLSTIYGNYAQGAGTLQIELGGTNPASAFQHQSGAFHDRLVVSGAASLAGTLSVSLLPGYTPALSDTLTVMTAGGGISGSFSNVPSGGSVSVDGTNGFLVAMTGTSLRLSSYHRIGPPEITAQPARVSTTVGGSATLTLAASSPIPRTLQWYRNSNVITGATNDSLVLTNLQTNDAGMYSATLSNADGSTNSSAASLVVLRLPVITAQPVSLLVYGGNEASFSVSAESQIPIDYQWRCNGTNIAGATNASYTLISAQSSQTGNYDVLLTTADGLVVSSPAQLALLSGFLLNVTNTSLAGAWGVGSSNWSSSPVNNPFSTANGSLVAAVFTNGFGSILPVDAGGVTVNSLIFSNSSGSLLMTGGGISFAGASPTLAVQSGGFLQLGSSMTLGVAGAGTLTKSGAGSLRIDGTWNGAGTLAFQQGSLSVGSTGNLSDASVILSPLTTMTLNGTAGNIRVGGNGYNVAYSGGNGSAGSANFTASNGVIKGSLVIDPPADGGRMAYAAPNMPMSPSSSVGTNYGYGILAGTMTVGNLVLGGRLDINGNQPMTIRLSGGYTNGPSNFIGRGSGIIVNYARNMLTNTSGGLGNEFFFSNGTILAGFFNSTNSTATLVGAGTATIGMFGQGAGNSMASVPGDSVTYFSGGTWRLGQTGQNNSYQCAAGSFVITNGAIVQVGGNTSAGGPAYSHGSWIVQHGSLQFLTTVAEGNGALAALIHTLQMKIATNGILSVTGDLQLGVSGSAGQVTGPPSELSVRGGSGTLTGLFLGNGNSTTAIVSNGVVNAFLESGSLSIGSNGLCVGYDGANLVSGATNSFQLSGGKLLIAGNLRAGSSPGQTNAFRWTGGQLSASAISATNAGWNDPTGSIRSGTLHQTAGTIAPGDVFQAGLTALTGNFVQTPSSTTDIDIGGVNPATSHVNGTGFHDRITVSGVTTLSGSLRIRLLPGYTPSSTNFFQILASSNGVWGGYSNALTSGRYVTEDGSGSFQVIVTSNMVTLGSYSPASPPVINSQPQSVQALRGTDVSLSVVATAADLPLTYQWRFNGSRLPGATNPSLSLPGVEASAAGDYDVVIASPESWVISGTARVSLLSPPVFNLQPMPVTVSSGQNILLTSSVSSTLPFTLQWRRNGVVLLGETNASLSIPSATVSSSGSYDLVASSAAGSVPSDPADVTVLPLTYAPMQGFAALAGTSNSIRVSATSSSALGYQWKRDGVPLPGVTSPVLSFPSLSLADSGLYSVTITNSLGTITTKQVAVVVARPFSNPAALYYPLSNAPASGSGAVMDLYGRTSGTLITPVTNGSTVSRINATNLPSLLTNESLPSGRAWDFTQTPSYINVPPSASNPIGLIGDVNRTDGLSLAFWINFDFHNSPVSTRDNRRILSVGNGTTIDVRTGHTAGLHKGIISAYFGNNANIPEFFVSTPASSTSNNAINGRWHHIAVTIDYTQALNNVRLFVDGTNVATQTEPITSSFNSTNQPVFLGGRDNNKLPTQLFGKLAMMGLFTRALTPGEIGQLMTLPSILNYAPTVVADSDTHSLEWPDNRVNVLGIASDDGVPEGQGISYRWLKVSGNGNVSFDQVTNASTAATFSSPGIYVLRLTANDGQYENFSDVTVNVATNAAPVVYAGASARTIRSGSVVMLTGGATDDGLPVSGGGVLSYSWSQISGPGMATLASPSSNNTSVTMPTETGVYGFVLTASDGYRVGSNTVTLTVLPDLPPVVRIHSPAPMIDLNVTNQATLVGSAAGIGTLTYSWSQLSGPPATILVPGSASTGVMIGEEADYQFRLTVGNGVTSSSSDLWISAVKSTPGVPFPSARGTNMPVNMGSANPAPFVHPRIFFTEEDRAALKAAMTDTNNPVATNAIAQLRSEVTNSIDKPSTPIGAAYARLKTGDPEVDIQGVAKLIEVPYKTFQGTAGSGLYAVLASACYLAWLDHDNPATQQRLKDLATAVATSARQHSTWYLHDRMYWSGSSDPKKYSNSSYDVYSDLALCYDFIYNWMTEEQRGVTRKLLADMTFGRLTQGALEDDYVLSTNHRIFHDHLVIAQLAIEGEPGYDLVSLDRNRLKLKSYFSVWGIGKEGFNREGPGYFAFGMHNGTPAAYALSRRGENLFVTTHLYASFQEYFYQMAPDDTGKMYGHHDGSGWGNGSVSSTYYAIMKSVYPTDPYIDHVYRKGWENNVYSRMPLTCAIFARPFVTSGRVREVAAAKGMSPSIFAPLRGIGVSRSDWSTNAIFVDFDCRGDCMQLGHLHSDRNSFTLYALGREWFMGQGYHLTENDSKQTVLIDGLGAAGSSVTRASNSPLGPKWPSLPGKFLEFSDSPRLTIMAGDASPTYTYSWSSMRFTPPLSSFPSNSAPTPYRWRDLFYPGTQFPNPQWGDHTWLDTFIQADATTYNPVAKAFRTILLVRGGAVDPTVTNTSTYPRSYTLILDDIRSRDTNTHAFTWSGNTVSHYDVADMALTNATTNSAVMYHTGDQGVTNRPQMLVSVPHANGSGTSPIALDNTPLDNGEGPQVTLRVQLTRSNTVSPDFKVLLYPHLNGEPLPTSSYSQTVTNGVTNGVLTIDVPTNSSGGTVRDIFRLSVPVDGRTRLLSYSRGGATPPVITVPPDIAVTTGSNTAVVNFQATARDASNSPVAVSMNPVSGSSFPIGTTDVNVSASDVSGNTSTTNFRVTVTPVTPTLLPTTEQIGSLTVGAAGSIYYDTNTGTYTVNGRGGAMGTTDSCTAALVSWTNNGVFTARVASLSCADGNGMAFLTARASTNGGDPAVVMGITAAGIGVYQFRSTTNGTPSVWRTNGVFAPEWIRLVRNGTNFSGYLSSDGTNWSQVGPLTASGLASNTVLQVGLGASPNGIQYTAYASFDQVSFLSVPAMPQGLTASNGVSSVGLLWTAVPGADGYAVQRSVSSNGSYSNIATVSLDPVFRDTNLPSGIKYYYRVAATNAAGEGPSSTYVGGGRIPPAPVGISAMPESARVRLSWEAGDLDSTVSVKRTTQSGGPYTTVASGISGTSFMDEAVTAGSSYYYVLTFSNGAGESLPSQEVSAVPLTPLQSWRFSLFGTASNAGIASDTANPSGDGIPNLMKYALGLSPLSTNAAAKPLAVLTNGCLQISFTRTNDPTLLYSVEGTSDFSSWTPVWSSTGFSNINGPITVRDTNSPVSSTTRRFLRLRVTTP